MSSTKFEIPQIASLHCEDALRRAEIRLIAKECGFEVIDRKANETPAHALHAHVPDRFYLHFG